MNNSITCTNKTQNIMRFGFEQKRAERIRDSVCEVNVHHHTKTCRKYETDCRFIFPRLPSMFNIIAQDLFIYLLQHIQKEVQCPPLRSLLLPLSSPSPHQDERRGEPGAPAVEPELF